MQSEKATVMRTRSSHRVARRHPCFSAQWQAAEPSAAHVGLALVLVLHAQRWFLLRSVSQPTGAMNPLRHCGLQNVRNVAAAPAVPVAPLGLTDSSASCWRTGSTSCRARVRVWQHVACTQPTLYVQSKVMLSPVQHQPWMLLSTWTSTSGTACHYSPLTPSAGEMHHSCGG